MVGGCTHAFALELGGQIIGIRASLDVHDAGAIPMPPHDLHGLSHNVAARLDAIAQIRSVKSTYQHSRGLQAQLRRHILAHTRCSRGRQGHHRQVRPRAAQLADHAVFRPEIVAPMADAVRLINRQPRDLPAFQSRQKAVTNQSLG